MSIEAIVLITAGAIFLVFASVIVYRRLPKKLKPAKFDAKWKELQTYCKDRSTWTEAIISADKLLDEALRKRKFAGNSTGERLVSASKFFTDNDAVWHAHNLYKKVAAEPTVKPSENDVKKSLVGFRQALRDLGALPNGERKSS